MVQTLTVFEWWSENRTKNVYFMVQNVQYSIGPPYRMIRPFENRTDKVSEKLKVQISGIGIQMVMVKKPMRSCTDDVTQIWDSDFRCKIILWLFYCTLS